MGVEFSNFQGGLTSFLMAGVNKPGVRVLEVGCGTGTHAEIVATSLLGKEGQPILVSCDFSAEMVKMVDKRF